MKKTKLLLAPVLTLASLVAVAIPAQASTVSSQLNITANVAASCSFEVPANVDVGQYNPTAESTMAVDFKLTCSNTVAYDIGIDKGLNGADVTTRQLKSADNELLNYSLKLQAENTNWGDTAGSLKTGVGNGALETFSGVVTIPSGQFVKPGTFTDTVTVTLTY